MLYLKMKGSEKLSKILEYLSLTPAEFADEIGLKTKQVIYDIQNDKVDFSKNTIIKINEHIPEISTEWLLTGSGEMLKTNVPITKTSPEALPLIPFEALAGHLSADNEGISYEDCEQYVIPEFKRQGAEFIIRVSGSSMYPKYSNGDLLGCRIIREMLFFQWGKIYVIDTSQGTLVKRIYQHENEDYVTLVSDNKEHYPPFAIPKTDIRSISIVIGVIRLE